MPTARAHGASDQRDPPLNANPLSLFGLSLHYIPRMTDSCVANRHTLSVLEFDKVVDATAGFCLTPMGGERIRSRKPSADRDWLDARCAELREMMKLIMVAGFPMQRVPDIRPLIEKSALEGAFLDPAELLQVGEFLSGVDTLLGFAKSSRETAPLLEEYLESLSGVYPLRVAISKAITPEGEVSDSASPELSKIRREKRGARDAVVARLERILAQRKSDPSRMDDLITLRNDRFVIPVREGDPSASEGIIQDRSSSGATLYVEPMQVVEFNNRLQRLGLEEAREVRRILLAMTEQMRENRDALLDDVDSIGSLDAIHALARFGLHVDGLVPDRVESASITLREARHPLLVLKQARLPREERTPVVPMSVAIGEKYSAIIVTGPNTGGKTVSLKTIGLLTLMAQAGWPLPCKDGTSVGLFEHVIADIGDEQSIESSLSTFSSHLMRINDALERANDRTLVLLDELGAGTDPKEGAALGEAIISELTNRGTRLVVTTHHSALKTLSQHDPRIENASLVFDVKTLSPTYQFRVGLPGASYAIDIARRLGVSDTVIEKAMTLVDAQERDLTLLLNELDERLETIRIQQGELEQKRRAAESLEALYKSRVDSLEKSASERKSEALAEAERIVETTRREMEKVVREIRESHAEKERVRESHHIIADRLEEIREQKRELVASLAEPEEVSGPIEVGDKVWVEAFKKEGEVADIDSQRGKLKIRIGQFLYTLDRSAVTKVKGESTAPLKLVPKVRIQTTAEIGPELSLRGESAEDAIILLDRYLDDAIFAGWQEVRIVHGKGEGILRRAVTEFLARDKRVESKRLGQWNEGAEGVTIAKLKSA